MVWLLLVALVFPVQVFAQGPADAPQQPFRKWDAGGSFGFRSGIGNDPLGPLSDWNIDVSRYWTTHIKTSVSVATAGDIYSVAWEMLPHGSYQQTLDHNVFVHPYVSAGARLVWFSESRQPYSSSFQLLSAETLPSGLRAQPFVAGGFKSYFNNGRVFMRSELLMIVAPPGASHQVLRIGAGIDF